MISVFWFGESQDSFALNEKLLGSNNLLSKSCSQHPYYYREVISFFWFGGSKTCLPSPVGGRQTKSCSGGKTYLAKVDRSAQVTIEKWPPFFDLGSVSWPQRRCRWCGVAGGAALQAVRRCRRWASAPGAARLVLNIRYHIPTNWPRCSCQILQLFIDVDKHKVGK